MPFKYLNLQPLGLEIKDCVCRAISLALDIDYNIIEHKLELIADLYDCDMLCVCCYKYLLDHVFELDRIPDANGMTVGDFAYYYNKGTYIVRVDGHLTCIKDGVNYDIWDTRDQIIDIVWEV